MKPASFEYFAPETVAEAVALLSQYGPDAKVLAGGQSLVPLLNLRIVRPRVLVDIGRLQELRFIKVHAASRCLTIGAVVTQTDCLMDLQVRETVPLLAQALRWVGHPATRNRGTVVGSIAHADPAAEAPMVLLALDGEAVARGPNDERTIPAGDIFIGPMTTSVAPDEIVTEARLPIPEAGSGWAFEEVARRHGDFAIVAVACLLTFSNEKIKDARIVVGGTGGRPERVTQAEDALKRETPSAELCRAAGQLAADSIEAASDLHGTAEYRKHLASVLTVRALMNSMKSATTGKGPL